MNGSLPYLPRGTMYSKWLSLEHQVHDSWSVAAGVHEYEMKINLTPKLKLFKFITFLFTWCHSCPARLLLWKSACKCVNLSVMHNDPGLTNQQLVHNGILHIQLDKDDTCMRACITIILNLNNKMANEQLPCVCLKSAVFKLKPIFFSFLVPSRWLLWAWMCAIVPLFSIGILG